MAVTFISNGYAPYSSAAQADAFPSIGQATYGVRNPADWKATAVPGVVRTVSISAGKGYGRGVTDKTFEAETIQLDPITAGSRWDLITCRRNWTPGESSFWKINGGANPVIPGGRQVGPGNIDDQPLWLVQVTAGEDEPTGFIDLRTHTGDGGGLIANHDLVLAFMNAIGTRININGVDWIRRADADNNMGWFSPNEPTVYTPVTAPGWTITGAVTVEPAGSKRRVTVDVAVKRTGVAFTLGSDAWEMVAPVIPAAVQVSAPVKYLPIVITGGSNHILAAASLNPAGSLTVRSANGPHPFSTGAQFTVNASYYI